MEIVSPLEIYVEDVKSAIDDIENNINNNELSIMCSKQQTKEWRQKQKWRLI